jgi:hypothetical protein
LHWKRSLLPNKGNPSYQLTPAPTQASQRVIVSAKVRPKANLCPAFDRAIHPSTLPGRLTGSVDAGRLLHGIRARPPARPPARALQRTGSSHHTVRAKRITASHSQSKKNHCITQSEQKESLHHTVSVKRIAASHSQRKKNHRIMRLRLNGSDHRTIKQSPNHQISVSTH